MDINFKKDRWINNSTPFATLGMVIASYVFLKLTNSGASILLGVSFGILLWVSANIKISFSNK